MTSCFDPDAYLRRIGYDGGRAPTLGTLRDIHRLHAQTIPFENLDPLLRRPMQLDAAWLQDKLVGSARGDGASSRTTCCVTRWTRWGSARRDWRRG